MVPNSQAGERIIVALDVDSTTEALKIVDELRDRVGAFKVGLQLFTSAGPSFVKDLTTRGIKIFLDLKFHDIPNTVIGAGIEAARMGVWMFNVHASGGSEMMRRTAGEVAEVCERESLPRPKMIGVTVLTSSSDSILDETGIERNALEQVLRLSRLTNDSGLDGVVASGLETAAIRKEIGRNEFLIVTPGVRPGSGTNDDQMRVITPGAALRAGADHLVIGRPITKAEDRSAALDEILLEIAHTAE
jgi:orotidine-5'-phosphate decarboxylase